MKGMKPYGEGRIMLPKTQYGKIRIYTTKDGSLMQSMLINVENNIPKEETAFKKVDDDKIRGWCNFKKVCD
jgi:hypothetical protein